MIWEFRNSANFNSSFISSELFTYLYYTWVLRWVFRFPLWVKAFPQFWKGQINDLFPKWIFSWTLRVEYLWKEFPHSEQISFLFISYLVEISPIGFLLVILPTNLLHPYKLHKKNFCRWLAFKWFSSSILSGVLKLHILQGQQ